VLRMALRGTGAGRLLAQATTTNSDPACHIAS
jgi:hypothetical protein